MHCLRATEPYFYLHFFLVIGHAYLTEFSFVPIFGICTLVPCWICICVYFGICTMHTHILSYQIFIEFLISLIIQLHQLRLSLFSAAQKRVQTWSTFEPFEVATAQRVIYIWTIHWNKCTEEATSDLHWSKVHAAQPEYLHGSAPQWHSWMRKEGDLNKKFPFRKSKWKVQKL